MAYLQEAGEALHLWIAFPQKTMRWTAPGINWCVFWVCWQVMWSRYLLGITTPWFQVLLSSGHRDFDYHRRWYGIRFNHGHTKNWQINDGGVLFFKSDKTLSCAKYTEN